MTISILPPPKDVFKCPAAKLFKPKIIRIVRLAGFAIIYYMEQNSNHLVRLFSILTVDLKVDNIESFFLLILFPNRRYSNIVIQDTAYLKSDRLGHKPGFSASPKVSLVYSRLCFTRHR
ncbi:hypothetical protein PHYBLDRAFT_60091 [Phycomyces blakesleeanus NRRL 1555(-)]|uniref:Uncharacterized protein n=1 Tax=Phycomyces blakesleeanus (strain ATCC 8743b / DSM 1359 / FGSC 10004 / NBRC 33097 / NRRL 1555) TaxID=763407 RepID=A0A163DBH6_PHYB8|nr:hypothetical protein PHYBLDRAFT_60091 [Phycomyces blakesleeanus NRRL 1555(-)]OAD70190.1 hypothetical protein PHYBLDRAFT_60091 [Phycomyces blakesleeanus NRRL 1555(-)]|eukprot:XP_018288230.1 hypothetical protein PHYBLDRAFT_60091 [Phycomyces blakesleeanus NRRL 1555(-)]